MQQRRLVTAVALVLAACLAPSTSTAAVLGPGTELSDLPLVEVPAAVPGGHRLAVVLSGDGDWAATVRDLGQQLASRGVAVVGLKSRSYLSRRPTPEQLAGDVDRIVRHYSAAWGRNEVVLIGYSRGADFIPFVVNRLSADVRSRLQEVAMIGPAETADFEFHLIDLIRDTPHPTDIPTLPELERMTDVRALCVYGADEADSLCRIAPPGRVVLLVHPGGHHLRDEEAVIGEVSQELVAGRP